MRIEKKNTLCRTFVMDLYKVSLKVNCSSENGIFGYGSHESLLGLSPFYFVK